MYVLMHSNVDSDCGEARHTWLNKPNKEDIKEAVLAYHDENISESVAEELFRDGECDLNNMSNTHYEIQEI